MYSEENMFGYVRPIKSELLVKDSEFYSAVYCGLCRYGSKNVSHLTSWLLNYDFVLLALLRMSFSEESVCIKKELCPYKLKKKNCVCADGSYAFVCSAFGLLTYEKLLDDINDEKGVKRFAKQLIRPFFGGMRKKSLGFEGLESIVKKGIAATAVAESEKCSSIDRAADGSAVMMGEIVSHGLEGSKKRIAFECGYHIGRFVYIADAFDDCFDDEKNGSYNPLLLKYGTAKAVMEEKDKIFETMQDSLNAFSNSYALACNTPQNGVDRLIFNICELGGRNAAERIIERNTKK